MKLFFKTVTKALILYLFSLSVFSSVYAENLGYTKNGIKYTRDFDFGLSDLKQAVGSDVYERFLNKKAELPDEIPVFKPYEPTGKREFYVAENGSDFAPGTIDKPFKTVKRALENMKNVGDRSGGVVIYIRGGSYDMSDGLVIPEYASGTDKAPLIISNYQNEEVKFVGGISISGDTLTVADDEVARRKLPESALGKVYSVHLPSIGIKNYGTITTEAGPPNCYVGNVKYNLARFPNATMLTMKKYEESDGENGVIETGPIINTSELGPITGETGEGFEFALANKTPFTWENTGNIWMYGSFYAEWRKQYVQVRSFNPEKMSVRSVQASQYGARYVKDNEHYYFNIMEELDIPGEWFIDYETGMFYIFPVSSDFKDMNISISTTSNDIVTFDNCSNVVLNGITVTTGGNNGITMNGVRNLVQNCVIENVVKYGVEMHSEKSGLISSVVKGTGNFSVHVYPRESSSILSNTTFLTPTRNFVQNCYLYNGLRGIYNSGGVQNIFSHNCVMNSQAMSINMYSGNEMIVEYNEVVGGPYATLDSAQVYVAGTGNSRGDHVRYNYFHDSRSDGSEKHPNAVYFDDRASGHYAYGNIMQGGGYFSHGGSDNVVENNIIVEIPKGQLSMSDSLNYLNGYEERWANNVVNNKLWYGMTNYSSIYTEIWRTRYPEFYDWTINLREHQKNYNSPDHVKDELEEYLRMPRFNVFKNNIFYRTDDYKVVNPEYQVVYENNKIYEENPGFADYENRNYNLNEDSLIFENHPEFKALPKQSKMGVIIDDSLFPEKLKMNEIIPVSPLSGENDFVINTGVVLNWTESFGASYYHVVVAEDADFTSIIQEANTPYNSLLLGELEFGKTYYWKVTAHTLAQSMDSTEIIMPITSFKVYSEEDAEKYIIPDTYMFDETVKEMKKILEAVTDDDGSDLGFGLYKQGTKAKVDALITEAVNFVKSEKKQSEIDKKADKLPKDILNVLIENAIPYTRKIDNFCEDEWINSNTLKSLAEFSEDKKGLTVSSESNFIMYYNKFLSPRETAKFSVKYETLDNWTTINIKQTEAGVSSPTGVNGYYVVIKPDVIELQRKPQHETEANSILVTIPNNRQVIDAGKWYEVTTLAEPVEDGIRVLFTVDGNTVIDFVDTVNPVYDLGCFAFMHNAGNGSMSLRAVE